MTCNPGFRFVGADSGLYSVLKNNLPSPVWDRDAIVDCEGGGGGVADDEEKLLYN